MLIKEEGIWKINWKWRRNLFQWENELMEICNSLVLGIERKEDRVDRWQWGGECYTVKMAYQSLIEGEGEEPIWTRDVWNPLIPMRFSTLAWRLFQNRLPTKENLRRRGININSSFFCVGGCGELESEDHLFFNCPILSMAWKEIARWLGISVAFVKGGYDHFLMFKGLISGRTKVKERLGILWLSTVDAIWKARNAMIFNNANFNWERVVEDIKVSSWKILKARDKNFSCSLYEWNSNPLICMGARGLTHD
jgi:hypothetical protein